MINYNFVTKDRVDVLNYSLQLEFEASLFLSIMLSIDLNDSKSLSNKSSSMSMKSKINLLSDMSMISKEDAKKFELFVSIRNQFMHNLSASDYENCLSFIEGGKNRLMKLYPQENSDYLLDKGVRDLVTDLHRIIKNVVNSIKDSFKVKAERDYYKEQFFSIVNAFKNDG